MTQVTSRETATPAAHLQHAAPAHEERVSVLVGDRLCAKCGYNLTGQMVVREPHYRMLIVRCPECATVASMQEYPLLGRWANRWAAIIAGLCLIVLLGLWIGSGAIFFGFGVGVGEFAADTYGDYLATQYSAWQQSQSTSTNAASAATTPPQNIITTPGGQVIVIPSPPPQSNGLDFSTWWTSQDHAALFAQAGGWRGAIDWRSLWLWIPMCLIAIAVGCVWAVIFLGRGRRMLLACAGAIMLVSCFFSFFAVHDWLTREAVWYHTAARSQISPLFLLVTLSLGAVALVCGLMIGRPLARGLVRLMLPPRLRSSLALLWIADGLRPPLVNVRSRK